MGARKKALILVAHADDETIGAGGYIPLLKQKGYEVAVAIASDCIVFRNGEYFDNKPACKAVAEILQFDRLHFLDMKDQEFENYTTQWITEKLRKLDLNPDLIITHSDSDLNRDHRIVNEIAMIIGRPVQRQICILNMEIFNNNEYYGGSFPANFYIDIAPFIELKIQAFECYTNEARDFPHPYSVNGIEAKARQRGMEVGYRYAEAYHVVRWFSGAIA